MIPCCAGNQNNHSCSIYFLSIGTAGTGTALWPHEEYYYIRARHACVWAGGSKAVGWAAYAPNLSPPAERDRPHISITPMHEAIWTLAATYYYLASLKHVPSTNRAARAYVRMRAISLALTVNRRRTRTHARSLGPCVHGRIWIGCGRGHVMGNHRWVRSGALARPRARVAACLRLYRAGPPPGSIHFPEKRAAACIVYMHHGTLEAWTAATRARPATHAADSRRPAVATVTLKKSSSHRTRCLPCATVRALPPGAY